VGWVLGLTLIAPSLHVNPTGYARTPPGEGERLVQVRDRLWSDFSFVASSRYREKVITSLASAPKLPGQLAEETTVSLPHVSRSLRELADRGLVECLTPSAKSHGRLYALTKLGSNVASYRQASGQRLPHQANDPRAVGFVPKIRASSAVRVIQYLKKTRGSSTVLAALKDWSVDAEELSPETWLSADAFDEFLELLVSRLGGGSYDFLRSLFSRVMPSIPSVREQIMRVIPLSALAETAPIAYGKELNYGRLIVKKGRRQVRFQHFDWMPTAGFCAATHGTYEGVLNARGVDGTVTKTQCARAGDDHCEYLVEW